MAYEDERSARFVFCRSAALFFELRLEIVLKEEIA
jgi:hypothetical protein